jgi:hypothetical protein
MQAESKRRRRETEIQDSGDRIQGTQVLFLTVGALHLESFILNYVSYILHHVYFHPTSCICIQNQDASISSICTLSGPLKKAIGSPFGFRSSNSAPFASNASTEASISSTVNAS